MHLHYHLSYSHPHRHLLDIRFTIENINSSEIHVQLPAWRPGRYELGNFVQYIKSFQPKDESGNLLRFEKVTKDLWKIFTNGSDPVQIDYSYYANEITAGSTYLDERQLYVNSVNCLLYVPERINEPCSLNLQLPENYEVATGLKKDFAHHFSAMDYHELVDCPLIASPSLQKNAYVSNGVNFTIWFQGEVKPDWEKVLSDFKKFTDAQFQLFGSFPFTEYHFLFQILPERFYHGVEHTNSTVIALGPGCNLFSGKSYEDLLGVSSHELFHAWNVKTIRPVEMQPYDYSRENYSRLGYVAEGVTTYYGDLMLLRAGVFSEAQYWNTFNELLERHFNNPGRFNLSVADSSFDTWIDGYKQGVPGRKTSIYTEGALCAFMLDVLIRQHTGNDFSLDDVMRELFHAFGKRQKGFSENDYKSLAEKIAGKSFADFFEKYIWGTASYEEQLTACLHYLGYDLKKEKSKAHFENALGFKIQITGEKTLVAAVYSGSPADAAGLSLQDEIIAVNGVRIDNNLNEWCSYFSSEKNLRFTISSVKQLKEITLIPDGKDYCLKFSVVKKTNTSREDEEKFSNWNWGKKGVVARE